MTAECRLEVRLEKKLPGFELDVSWRIGNELAVLFGYSGSGKSLSLRMIAGLVKPDSGRIVLNGEVVFDSEDDSGYRRRSANWGSCSRTSLSSRT